MVPASDIEAFEPTEAGRTGFFARLWQERFGEMPAAFDEAAKLFLNNSGPLIAQCDEALQQNQITRFRKAFHRLAGSAANFGDIQLVGLGHSIMSTAARQQPGPQLGNDWNRYRALLEQMIATLSAYLLSRIPQNVGEHPH